MINNKKKKEISRCFIEHDGNLIHTGEILNIGIGTTTTSKTKSKNKWIDDVITSFNKIPILPKREINFNREYYQEPIK